MVGLPEDFLEGSDNPALDAARLLRQRLEVNRGFGWDMPVGPAPRASVPTQSTVSGEIEDRETVLESIR